MVSVIGLIHDIDAAHARNVGNQADSFLNLFIGNPHKAVFPVAERSGDIHAALIAVLRHEQIVFQRVYSSVIFVLDVCKACGLEQIIGFGRQMRLRGRAEGGNHEMIQHTVLIHRDLTGVNLVFCGSAQRGAAQADGGNNAVAVDFGNAFVVRAPDNVGRRNAFVGVQAR